MKTPPPSLCEFNPSVIRHILCFFLLQGLRSFQFVNLSKKNQKKSPIICPPQRGCTPTQIPHHFNKLRNSVHDERKETKQQPPWKTNTQLIFLTSGYNNSDIIQSNPDVSLPRGPLSCRNEAVNLVNFCVVLFW